MLVKCTVMHNKLPPLRSQTTSYIAFNNDASGTIRVRVVYSSQSMVIMFIPQKFDWLEFVQEHRASLKQDAQDFVKRTIRSQWSLQKVPLKEEGYCTGTISTHSILTD